MPWPEISPQSTAVTVAALGGSAGRATDGGGGAAVAGGVGARETARDPHPQDAPKQTMKESLKMLGLIAVNITGSMRDGNGRRAIENRDNRGARDGRSGAGGAVLLSGFWEKSECLRDCCTCRNGYRDASVLIVFHEVRVQVRVCGYVFPREQLVLSGSNTRHSEQS
jgi:hypothetical protein